MKKINYSSLYTLRKDGRYMGYWRDAAGVRHAVYDKDPEKLHQKIQAKENAPVAPVTFKDVAERWERDHLSKVSRGTYSSYRCPFNELVEEFGDTPVADISAADVDRVMLREKNQGYSYKHAATVKSVFKQILDRAVLDKEIQYNPAASVNVPRGMKKRRVDAPESELVDQIVEHLDLPFGDFVAMLFYTGMRTEEAAALRWRDVEKDHINVTEVVDLHGTPKLKETKTEAGTRPVPIVEKHRRFLQMPAGADKNDYIFNDNGKLLTRGQISARWRRWCREAGLAERCVYDSYKNKAGQVIERYYWKPIIMPHQLRHHYATVLYEQKVDLLTAKDVMGHSDIATTHRIYTSLRKKHRAEEVAKINGGF